jgi:splicing factor 3A subunit 2
MLMGGLSALPKKTFVSIGTPKYMIKKIRDPLSRQLGLLCQISLPQIATGVKPHFRWMSAHEQKQEDPDNNYMWLIIAAEPYKSIGFKVQKKDVDLRHDKAIEWFDPDSKDYWLQIMFKSERDQRLANVPGLAPGARK